MDPAIAEVLHHALTSREQCLNKLELTLSSLTPGFQSASEQLKAQTLQPKEFISHLDSMMQVRPGSTTLAFPHVSTGDRTIRKVKHC